MQHLHYFIIMQKSKVQQEIQDVMNFALVCGHLTTDFKELNLSLDCLMLTHLFNNEDETVSTNEKANMFVQFFFMKRLLYAAEHGHVQKDSSITIDPTAYYLIDN